MNDEKKLSIEGLLSSGSDLNDASVRLNEVCTEMYKYVTALRESETFKTVVASTEYFANIDQLNAIVPKYEEAILRFSKFLTEYVVQNYTETDEETKNKIETNLQSSIEQLQGLGSINNQGLDYSKISSTSSNANQGNYIDSSKIQKQYFEDGELEFVTREDGSIQIVKDGTTMGFTTADAIVDTNFKKIGNKINTEELKREVQVASPNTHVPKEIEPSLITNGQIRSNVMPKVASANASTRVSQVISNQTQTDAMPKVAPLTVGTGTSQVISGQTQSDVMPKEATLGVGAGVSQAANGEIPLSQLQQQWAPLTVGEISLSQPYQQQGAPLSSGIGNSQIANGPISYTAPAFPGLKDYTQQTTASNISKTIDSNTVAMETVISPDISNSSSNGVNS